MDATLLNNAKKLDLSEAELHAAIDRLIELRSIDVQAANRAELAAEIIRFRQVEFALRATIESY